MTKNRSAFLILVFILASSFQISKTVKEQIIGTWIYESYIYPDFYKASQEDSIEYSKQNAGSAFIFQAGNKMIARNGSRKVQNTYSIPDDNKHIVINGVAAVIEKLDATHLSLNIPDHGTTTFKRKL